MYSKGDEEKNRIIPTRLNFDFCPFTFSDGTDEIGPIGDGVPGITACLEDDRTAPLPPSPMVPNPGPAQINETGMA